MKKIALFIVLLVSCSLCFSQNELSLKTLYNFDWSISEWLESPNRGIILTSHPKLEPIYNGLSPVEKLRRKHKNGNRYGEYIRFKNKKVIYSNYARCGFRSKKRTIKSIHLKNNTIIITYSYRKNRSQVLTTEENTYEIIVWSTDKIILKELI